MTITAIFPTEAPVTSQRSTFDDRIEQLWAATAQLPGQAVSTAAGLMAQLASVQTDAPLATAAARLALGIADTLAARGTPVDWAAEVEIFGITDSDAHTLLDSDANRLTVAEPASYDYPDTVLGTDGITYRCIGTGVVGEDPVGSVSGDWAALDPDPLATAAILFSVGLLPGWTLSQEGSDPAAPSAYVWSAGARRYRASLTWITSGAGDRVPRQAALRYSGNSGASYVDLSAYPLMVYDYASTGALIGVTWAAGFEPLLVGGEPLLDALAEPLEGLI
jgi:hypothetical protein